MDKITIIPGSVRGYGDVVSPKSLDDFMVFDSELSFEDGLYTLVYDASGVSVGLSVSSGSISVGESVVLTAEVLSAGEPVSEETVSFYDGTTLLGTDETDSDGIATYTASSLGVGSHSLTASALDKSSSAVTVTVNKLTSTITLSVPASGTVGTSYSITGTLVPTSGSVKLYENGSLKDTLTVSSGSFSKSITQSNEGTYSYYAVFEGSSTYSSVTSSTGSIVVSDVPPVPVVTSVGLSADKSILSYADSESATLSATVLDQSSQPMSGVTVEFFNGSTSMGTADTNSSGIATKTYASTGAGDLLFTASVGTISSETYTVEDCIFYGLNTNAFTIPSNTTFSSNGQYITATTSTTGEKIVYFNHTFSNNDNWVFENEVAYKGESEQLLAIIWNDNTYYGGAGYGENYVYSYMGSQTKKTHTVAIGDKFTVRRENGTTSVYINGDLIESKTVSHKSTFKVGYFINKGRTQYYKNIKIKPL